MGINGIGRQRSGLGRENEREEEARHLGSRSCVTFMKVRAARCLRDTRVGAWGM